MNFTTLFGSMNNQILDIYDETGTFVIDHIVIYDVEYIIGAFLILMCTSFVFKMFLTLIRGFMKNDVS